MTEDDTYRVLAQKPFEEVRKIAMKYIPDMETIEEADIFLRKYGWTAEEFERRLIK